MKWFFVVLFFVVIPLGIVGYVFWLKPKNALAEAQIAAKKAIAETNKAKMLAFREQRATLTESLSGGNTKINTAENSGPVSVANFSAKPLLVRRPTLDPTAV